MKDSPSDYRFRGDLWNCPNPQRLAVLYCEAQGWTDVEPQRYLTTGIGINVIFTDQAGEHRVRSIGASFLKDFANYGISTVPTPAAEARKILRSADITLGPDTPLTGPQIEELAAYVRHMLSEKPADYESEVKGGRA